MFDLLHPHFKNLNCVFIFDNDTHKVYIHYMSIKSIPDNRYIATNCACMKLRSATRLVTRAYDKALQPVGLKATQYTLLIAVSQAQPVSISRLADLMSMERTTLTRNLKPLEQEGLVITTPGHGRTVEVSLRRKGLALLKKAAPLWKCAQDDFVGELGERRWEDLSQILNSVTE